MTPPNQNIGGDMSLASPAGLTPVYGTQIFTTCVADFVAEIDYNTRLAVPTQPGSVTLRSVFGWITIFQRVDDALDWNRPWAQYKAGFGSIDDNFWLGLENGHRHMAL